MNTLFKGLQVILDAHSNLLAGGTVPEDFDGFYAIIDSKDQYPMTTRKSVLLRPGHNNFVSMSATKINSNDISDIHPSKRNCFFPKDRNMTVHRNYTQANCILECQLTYGLSKVSIPYIHLAIKSLLYYHLSISKPNHGLIFMVR